MKSAKSRRKLVKTEQSNARFLKYLCQKIHQQLKSKRAKSDWTDCDKMPIFFQPWTTSKGAYHQSRSKLGQRMTSWQTRICRRQSIVQLVMKSWSSPSLVITSVIRANLIKWSWTHVVSWLSLWMQGQHFRILKRSLSVSNVAKCSLIFRSFQVT